MKRKTYEEKIELMESTDDFAERQSIFDTFSNAEKKRFFDERITVEDDTLLESVGTKIPFNGSIEDYLASRSDLIPIEESFEELNNIANNY
jgi:hypothetical protein